MRAILAMALSFGIVQVAFGRREFSDISSQLPKHPSKRYGTRGLHQVKNIVIHHSAVDGKSPWQIARFHVESNHLDTGGAPAIAYHFYITERGKIYQTNPLDAVSWHVKNHNTESIGICLSGNFDNHPPTKEQKRSLKRLTKVLKRQFPQSRVLQHKDLRPTNCAGRYFDIRPYQ